MLDFFFFFFFFFNFFIINFCFSVVVFGGCLVFSLVDIFLNEKNITKEMFYLTTHSTHFIYGYMASDIW